MPDSVLKVVSGHVTDNTDTRLYVGGTTGAADNRLLRSDGAGGFTCQASAAVCDDSGNLSGLGTVGCGAITTTGTLALTGSMTVSGNVDGRDVSVDGTKLDGIEALADVTDDANVRAALAAATANVAFNAKKITGLADGTDATDAAAFGQLSCALMHWGAASYPAVDADRWPLNTYGAVTTVGTAGQQLATRAGTLSAIRFYAGASVATNTLVVTLQINGVDTALTCTVAAGGTTASLTGQAVAVAAGDRLVPKLRQNGTEANTNCHFRISVV